MNSSGIGGAGSAPVKTEWANDVTARAPVPQERAESFGEKLNRMAGVVEESKYKYGAKKDESLSKEAFLKMTMEQIKYQDPMDPVKNEQFTQQMAMLSQLEQQVNMNSTLKSILDSSRNMQIAALQLVGRDVSADTGIIYHDSAKSTALQFKLPQNASDLKVEILNDKDEVLDTMDLGAREAGVVATKWDGMMKNDIPAAAGNYLYRIVAKDASGKSIDVPTKIEGRVSGVTTSKGTTYLLVGEQKVALNDVQSIHEAKNQPLAPNAVGNSAGMENVSKEVAGSGATTIASEVAVSASASKPRIEVSDDVKKSLSEEKDNKEVSSLFPILYP